MITLDLDDMNKNRAMRKARLLSLFCSEVCIRESSSRTGFHVKGFEDGLEFNEECKIRFFLGDDVRRIHIDNERRKLGVPTQVLFTQKKGKKSTEWISI